MQDGKATGAMGADRVAARRLDASAIGLSALCLAHCLTPSFAAVLLPLAGLLPGEDGVHLLFFLVAAPVTLFALRGRSGATGAPIGLAAAALGGLALLGLGAAGPEPLERGATVSGALLLAGVHLANWARRRARAAG
jgi:hypothetical protein